MTNTKISFWVHGPVVSLCCLLPTAPGVASPRNLPTKQQLEHTVKRLEDQVRQNEAKLQTLEKNLENRRSGLQGNSALLRLSLGHATVAGTNAVFDGESCQEVWFNQGDGDDFNTETSLEERVCPADHFAVGMMMEPGPVDHPKDQRIGAWCCKVFIQCAAGFRPQALSDHTGYRCVSEAVEGETP